MKVAHANGTANYSCVLTLLQTAVQVAREMLEAQEQQGGLCRDVSLEGVKFFPNRLAAWGKA